MLFKHRAWGNGRGRRWNDAVGAATTAADAAATADAAAVAAVAPHNPDGQAGRGRHEGGGMGGNNDDDGYGTAMSQHSSKLGACLICKMAINDPRARDGATRNAGTVMGGHTEALHTNRMSKDRLGNQKMWKRGRLWGVDEEEVVVRGGKGGEETREGECVCSHPPRPAPPSAYPPPPTVKPKNTPRNHPDHHPTDPLGISRMGDKQPTAGRPSMAWRARPPPPPSLFGWPSPASPL